MQPHIVGHSRKATSGVKRALAEIVAAPVLGQALEAVKAVNDPVADLSRDETNRAAGENPEFEIVPLNLHNLEGERQQFGRRLEADRVRHGALDIVRRALQCAQRALAHWMDATDVPKLVEGADDLVEDIFQLEVRHQHWS